MEPMTESVYKLEIFLPEESFDPVCRALWSADAGHIGRYDRCLSWSRVHSCWRPLEGTDPYLGRPGQLYRAEETLAAVKAAHPYEEPVINVLPLYKTGL